MALTTPIIIVFRATPGYVTDGARTVQAGVNGLGNIVTYPTSLDFGSGDVLNGGWDAITDMEGRDRNTGIPELAGIVFVSSGAAARYFQLDLPNSTYRLWLGAGDRTGYTNNLSVVVKDGPAGSTLATIANAAIPSDSFMDAQGNAYSAASFLASQAPLDITLTNGAFVLQLPSSVNSNRISYVQIQDLGAAAPTTRARRSILI